MKKLINDFATKAIEKVIASSPAVKVLTLLLKTLSQEMLPLSRAVGDLVTTTQIHQQAIQEIYDRLEMRKPRQESPLDLKTATSDDKKQKLN